MEKRAKIMAIKKTNGRYVMGCYIDGQGIEYPQEGREHDSTQTVYSDAAIMYADRVWRYNRLNHTIVIN